jgi:hypothetical protein
MRCWNCGRQVRRSAQVCQYCEAAVEPEPSEEEKEAVREILGQMPADALEELRSAIEQSDTAEDFVNRIFIGDCPKCGSHETGHCENDPEIGELLVGHCFECGQLWCSECGRLLEPDSASCPCWEDEE